MGIQGLGVETFSLVGALAMGLIKGVPWLAEVQTRAPHLRPLLVDEEGRPIASLEAWEKHRARIRQRWLEFLGLERIPSFLPSSFEVLQEERREGVRRQLIRYRVEPDLPTEAYLLLPEEEAGPFPGVVVLHSTSNETIRQGAGLGSAPEKAFGWQLARRGIAAICPRCFLWPSDLEPPETRVLPFPQRAEWFRARHPGCRGMAKMLYDARVALEVLLLVPQVDKHRLGAVGHSLGAKEVLYLAAFDERIQAAVFSEGGIGLRFSNWDAPWYLGEEVRSPDFPWEHHELLALVAPRAFLLIGGDSADGSRSWPFIEAVLPVYRLYGEEPRVGLFNHGKGHTVPPEAQQRMMEWMMAYL